MSVFIDTNILLYAVGTDPAELTRREIAQGILSRRDCVLSVQVLQEFLWQSTRPKRNPPLSFDEAVDFVTWWRRFPVQENTLALMDQGVRLTRQHRFALWDSMVVAAALAQGCEILYTEDMQDGRIIDRLRIVNPFR